MTCCNDKWDRGRDLYNSSWGHISQETRQKNKPWEQEQVLCDPIGWAKIGACPCLYFGANLARMYGQTDGGMLSSSNGFPYEICPPPLLAGCADVHSLLYMLGGGQCFGCCCPNNTLNWACMLCICPFSIPLLKYAMRRDMYFKYGLAGLREGGYTSACQGGYSALLPCFWPVACMQCRQESAELDFHEGQAANATVAPS
jgi:hypothetical protein